MLTQSKLLNKNPVERFRGLTWGLGVVGVIGFRLLQGLHPVDEAAGYLGVHTGASAKHHSGGKPGGPSSMMNC